MKGADGAARHIRLHPADNVAVAIEALESGAVVQGAIVAKRIPAGHKVAIEPIAIGAPIRKYGQPIGLATAQIGVGEWVHEHNVAVTSSNPGSVAVAETSVAPLAAHSRATAASAGPISGTVKVKVPPVAVAPKRSANPGGAPSTATVSVAFRRFSRFGRVSHARTVPASMIAMREHSACTSSM